MATAKTKAIGRVRCVNRKCDELVIVRKNEAGGLNCGCGICDIEVRHKNGTQSHADCMDEMLPLKAGTAPAKPAPAKQDPAKQDPAKQDPAKQDPAKQEQAKGKKTNWLGVEVEQ